MNAQRLRELADGCEGSAGEVTLGPADAGFVKELDKRCPTKDLGGGACSITAKDLRAMANKASKAEAEANQKPAAPAGGGETTRSSRG